MGVLNVTPDSFSDGGRFLDPQRAIERANQMVANGATIIDIGGESTRPGAAEVSTEDELQRVIPVLESLRASSPAILSVDTSKPEVMRAAIQCGAHVINDVRGLSMAGALEAVADSDVMVCLMHMQGQPRTMQANPHYRDVCQDVWNYLEARIVACEAAGIDRRRLLIDPGFGFGKTLQHNLSLLANLHIFERLHVPLLVGLSRKSMFGHLLEGAAEDQRVHASVTAAVLAVQRGADIVRVHDVAATRDALRVLAAVMEHSMNPMVGA